MNSKSKIFLLLLIGVSFYSSGCKKLDKYTQFNMAFDDSVVIPSSTGINLPLNILSQDVETNSESTFEVNDTRKDLVEEINLTALELTILTPSAEDFSFLKSITIFLNAEGLPETKVAWNDNVSSTVGKILSLEVNSADLKEFIKKDKFSLRVNTITDEILTSDYSINVHSVFYVDAKILGQ